MTRSPHSSSGREHVWGALRPCCCLLGKGTVLRELLTLQLSPAAPQPHLQNLWAVLCAARGQDSKIPKGGPQIHSAKLHSGCWSVGCALEPPAGRGERVAAAQRRAQRPAQAAGMHHQDVRDCRTAVLPKQRTWDRLLFAPSMGAQQPGGCCGHQALLELPGMLTDTPTP